MKTSLHISSDAQETGTLLKQYLTDRGVYSPSAEAVVWYGRPSAKVPHNLNGNRKGRNKMDNMRLIQDAGGQTVPWIDASRGADVIQAALRFPLLARKRHGMGGTDIVPVFQEEEIPWRIAAGWHWFSQYIPVQAEYRVWVYRGQPLDVYQKVMKRPQDYKHIGRNFRNGFDFERVTRYPADAFLQAAQATEAIGLDFAAVDLLVGKDGNVYVLETNTAPGVLQSKAEATLGKLADCMAQWVRDGYPERRVA